MVEHLRDLRPDPRNVNKGTERGRAMLEQSLRELGAGRSILADKHGTVIAGNKTLDVAAELDLPVETVHTDGSKLVVVVRDDLDLSKDAAAKRLALADNRVAEMDLAWDAELLAGLQDEGVDLSGLWGKDELAALLDIPGFTVSPLADSESHLIDEAPVRVKPGELWMLGDHRLACGDATDADWLGSVYGGLRPRVALIDPPFQLAATAQALAVRAAMALRPANILLWTGMAPSVEVPSLVRGGGYRFSHLLIWDRGEVHRADRAREHHNPLITCTLILCWRRDSTPALFAPDAALPYLASLGVETSAGFPQLLTVDRRADSDHRDGGGYAKPFGLVAALHAAYGASGPVLDLFSGSGTAFGVGTALGQVVYGVELDPRRCDVAIARWEAQTGEAASRQAERSVA